MRANLPLGRLGRFASALGAPSLPAVAALLLALALLVPGVARATPLALQPTNAEMMRQTQTALHESDETIDAGHRFFGSTLRAVSR